MPGASATPGRPSACVGALGHIAFRYTDSVGTQDLLSIAAQWLACTFPCRRFAGILTNVCARLGADVVRSSGDNRPAMPDNPGADLDRTIAQRGERPLLDILGKRQSAQEVSLAVGARAGKMAAVGRAFLRAVGLAHIAVHVEHDADSWPTFMDSVDPSAGQIGQCRQVGRAGQPPGLETAYLAGRGGLAIHSAAIRHRAHRRIVRKTSGTVHVPAAGEAAEHRLAQQADQQVAGILALTALRQRPTSQTGQPDRIVQFAVSEQSGVGGNAAAMEFQLQAAVEIDPQGTIIQFTR